MKQRWSFSAFWRVNCALLFASAALVSLAGTAHAQSDKAAAEALFREGMRLSKANDFKSACPKYEESLRLEPSLGAQYYLADCYEKVGRTASAWANFTEVADKERLAGDATKEKAARDRANALEAKLSHLSITVTDSALAGLTVRRGDVAIGSGQWGLSVPVDPGSYVIQASAPGHKDWSKTIDVGNGATVTETVPALEVLPAPVEPVAPPVAAPVSSPLETSPAPASSHTQRTAGQVVFGVGVVALGVSGVFALLAKSANNDSKAAGECTSDNICTKKGLSDRNIAVTRADTATVVSIIGAAAAITGGVLWLTAPHDEPETHAARAPQLGLGFGSVLVRGSF